MALLQVNTGKTFNTQLNCSIIAKVLSFFYNR